MKVMIVNKIIVIAENIEIHSLNGRCALRFKTFKHYAR